MVQVNIVITRSLGSNESNRVVSESCYTEKSTRKRFKKRSNNGKTIVLISDLVCTGVTCYVTAITYNNNNNIIKKNIIIFCGVTIVTFYNEHYKNSNKSHIFMHQRSSEFSIF